jgi:hypothetical protein
MRHCAPLTFSLTLTLALLLAATQAQAAGHRLACPAGAPADWGARLGPLEQAAVLFEKTGVEIDERAPPSLVPDRGFARGKVWHNIWLMHDEPGWTHYVHCQYRGSSRVLRLRADGLRQCEQTATPYRPGRGVAQEAVQTLVCH